MRSRLEGWTKEHRVEIAVCLVLLGIGTAGLLAYLASSDAPPTASQSALLVLISGSFQVAASWLFSQNRPSEDAIRLQLQHHVRIRDQIVEATRIAELAVDDGSAQVIKKAIGELSWRMSQINVDHTAVTDAWYDLNGDVWDNTEAGEQS